MSTQTNFSGLVGRVGIGLLDDLDDADDLLALVGMIEEGAVAFLHLHQILPRGEIAHAGPGLALGALCHLLIPRPGRRFRFHQPVVHDAYPTIRSLWPGLSRPSTSSCRQSYQDVDARNKSGHDEAILPLRLEWPRQQALDRRIDADRAARIAATAEDTGISTFFESASSTSTGAVNSPSASFPKASARRGRARCRARNCATADWSRSGSDRRARTVLPWFRCARRRRGPAAPVRKSRAWSAPPARTRRVLGRPRCPRRSPARSWLRRRSRRP